MKLKTPGPHILQSRITFKSTPVFFYKKLRKGLAENTDKRGLI